MLISYFSLHRTPDLFPSDIFREKIPNVLHNAFYAMMLPTILLLIYGVAEEASRHHRPSSGQLQGMFGALPSSITAAGETRLPEIHRVLHGQHSEPEHAHRVRPRGTPVLRLVRGTPHRTRPDRAHARGRVYRGAGAVARCAEREAAPRGDSRCSSTTSWSARSSR